MIAAEAGGMLAQRRGTLGGYISKCVCDEADQSGGIGVWRGIGCHKAWST